MVVLFVGRPLGPTYTIIFKVYVCFQLGNFLSKQCKVSYLFSLYKSSLMLCANQKVYLYI